MWSQSAWSRHRVPQLVTVDGAAETRHFDHTAVQCHSLSPCFHLQGWTPDLLTRFDEAVKEQGGIHLAKAKRTFEQMKCEGEQDAPTKIHIKSRISRLRTAENGRSSASAGLVTCSHPGCGKLFSRTDACLAHCKKKHPVWLKDLSRALGSGHRRAERGLKVRNLRQKSFQGLPTLL